MYRSGVIAGVLLGMLTLAPALADDDDDLEPRRLVQQGEILPLQRILQLLEREQPGRVLEVELERDDGRYVYEIELLDARGRVLEYEVDAASGEILKREWED